MVATTEASAPAGVAAAEACASKVSPANAATAEVTATATGMPAEGGCISGREHADRNRDGDGSEHGLESLADHVNLQYIAKLTVPPRCLKTVRFYQMPMCSDERRSIAGSLAIHPGFFVPQDPLREPDHVLRDSDQDREAEVSRLCYQRWRPRHGGEAVIPPWRDRGNVIAAAGTMLLDLLKRA
jgi:hypothetical protein